MGDSLFKPAWWLTNTHAQTIWPYLFQSPLRLNLIRERLELPDGDFIDLCWTDRKSNTIIIILHGLEGSINSHYARGMVSTLYNHGWQAVFMHFRGCSGEHNRLPRSYHSGDTGDMAYLIEILNRRHRNVKLFAIGYSLGGNALLKYLGESEDSRNIAGAVAVSVPFDLANGARRLELGMSRFYQRYLLKRLQNKIRSKFSQLSPPVSIDDISNLNTFRRFDGAVTAPLHGFKDADDYYLRSSSRQYLKNIRVPTLVIHAKDDPFMTPEAIPENNELSEQVKFELSDHGGHVGFVSGKNPFEPVYWLQQRIPEFICDVMNTR